MHGLGDLVAGFDEGGGNMGGAGGQEGFAVVLNFLVQAPMAHHNGQFGEPGAQQFAYGRLADNPPGGIKPTQNNPGVFCSTSCRISDKRLPAALISICPYQEFHHRAFWMLQ
jgi:hypothetical protein